MPNIRLLPPGAAASTTTAVPGGRSYTCALGTTLDVPDFDAPILQANGWTPATLAPKGQQGEVGTSVQRPTNPKKNQPFLDTTVGRIVVWDGKNWRDHVTGLIA